MIGLIQKMFGNGFWNNVILEATHWNYHNKSIRLRQETNPKITERGWTSELNALFRYFLFYSLGNLKQNNLHLSCFENFQNWYKGGIHKLHKQDFANF